MTLPASGTKISLSDIQTNLGGANPISLSEYYRGGTYIPSTSSSNIPETSTGTNRLGNYYGVPITYEIIGGGGAGGDSWENNHGAVAATSVQTGSNTTISGAFLTTIIAPGGVGGVNGVGPNGSAGLAGAASAYGAGGAGGSKNQSGGSATAYGAGGGGGGGDDGGTYDEGGPRGAGGSAGTRLTGSFVSLAGTIITVVIGAGGAPYGGGSHAGGSGGNGVCIFTKNGVTTTITASGTYTV